MLKTVGERGGTDLGGGGGGKGGTERTEQEKDVCFSTYFSVKVNLHSRGGNNTQQLCLLIFRYQLLGSGLSVILCMEQSTVMSKKSNSMEMLGWTEKKGTIHVFYR